LKLSPELAYIHTMLGRFVAADEDHRNVPSVEFLQGCVVINIHLMEDRPALKQNRCDSRFRFLAKMTSWTRVQRDVARPASSEAQIFGQIPHGLGFEYFMNGPECG
jgi:hypothetical protein